MLEQSKICNKQDLSLKCSAWKGFKNFGSKQILKKILGPKKTLGLKKRSKNFGPKNCCSEKKIWV